MEGWNEMSFEVSAKPNPPVIPRSAGHPGDGADPLQAGRGGIVSWKDPEGPGSSWQPRGCSWHQGSRGLVAEISSGEGY